MLGKLTALKVARTRDRGKYADGGGLYLQVASKDARSWIFRYTLAGRERFMGLGSVEGLALAEARELAAECRKLVRQGTDPIEYRNRKRAAVALQEARATTFKRAGEALMASHEAGWRNAKHRQQWRNTLVTYAFPVIGHLPVQDVDTTLVMKVIEPIWTLKPETAGRLRGRIERVLDWAKVRGLRTGENPARWRGHLDQLLPRKSKVHRIEHHAALPYAQLPAFVADLRQREGVSERALEFLILTAARAGEVRLASADEISFDARVWTIPAGRMKGGRQHRVPLCDAAMNVLKRMEIKRGELIFPGAKRGKPLSDVTLEKVAKRISANITPHGFRSTFRDWAAECTNFAREVAEMALAHKIDDDVEAAYRRGDLFDKRRRLMKAWGEYCESKPRTSSRQQRNIITMGAT